MSLIFLFARMYVFGFSNLELSGDENKDRRTDRPMDRPTD